jgi:hypothetical protein
MVRFPVHGSVPGPRCHLATVGARLPSGPGRLAGRRAQSRASGVVVVEDGWSMACQVARESEVCMTGFEVVVFLVLLLLLYWGLLWRARRRQRKQRWHDDAWR